MAIRHAAPSQNVHACTWSSYYNHGMWKLPLRDSDYSNTIITERENCLSGIVITVINLHYLRPVWQGFTSLVKPFFLLQLHEQYHRWSWSGFGKPFGKMASLWEHVFRGLEEPGEAIFLAPSHPKSPWKHVFRGFTSETILLYPV